ncbi:hypothetical protein KCU99_g9847, partial [Aureobasidium melanogenum]
MVTTRNGALKDRRVTRSMAAPEPTSSGVVKRKAAATPRAARKTAQKPKKTVPKKQNVTNPEPTLEDRATTDANHEVNATTTNKDTEIRAVTRSMTKNGDQTVAAMPSTSKKTSIDATKGKGASTKNRSKAATSHEGSAPPAARLTTRSMSNNVESTTTTAPPEPPTQAITRQMANQDALTPSSVTSSAPVDDVQARPRPTVVRITDPPRARRANARTMITPRVRIVRHPVTAPITAGQERYRIARTRASLRQPGRTHHDYFNLPIHHEALTTRPVVNTSIIPRVRAWYESLKTGTNDEEEEAIEET